MSAFPKYGYKYYTAATGATVKAGTGTLAAVTINKALTGTVTLKDGTNTIAILTNGATAPLGSVLFGGAGGIQFGVNLTISLSTAAEDVTVIYE